MDSSSDDLADAIVEANKQAGNEGRLVNGYPVLETDEFGFDRTERNLESFMAARTLMFNEQYKAAETERRGGRTPLGLHTRLGHIYRDNKLVTEDRQNMHKLCRWYGNVPYPRVIGYWEELRAHLPKLCPRYVEMSGDMFWDLYSGQLLHRSELDENAF